MKKYFSFLIVALMTLAFTGCEDVPAPFKINSEGGGSDTPSDVLLSADFASTLNPFTNYTTSGSGAWTINYSCATASGYDNSSKTTTAGTYYLVSPEIELPADEAAHITFDYILRYNKGDENQQLLITDDFNADDAAANWTVLNQTWTEGSDWNTFSAADIAIPESYRGKTVRVALRYNTNATSGSTWEVKNFKVSLGEGSGGGDIPSGEGYINAPFSSTLEPFTNYTTSGSGAWKINYSCATATGYDNSSKTTTAGTYYLVSPEVTLPAEACHITFDYILRYNKGDENQQLLISTAFDANNPAAGWTVLNQKWTEGKDWDTFSAADIAIPEEYQGKAVRVALRYNTNATSGSTWEVKNFVLTTGSGNQGGGGGSVTTAYAFKKVTSITSGKQYLLVAAGQAATLNTANYGYLKVVSATDNNGVITMDDMNSAFTITQSPTGAYTIQMSDKRYLYQTGTFNSFNFDASAVDGSAWSITPNNDGTFRITNASTQKYIQYSAQYTSYGSYSDQQGAMPALYEYTGTTEGGGNSGGGNEGGNTGGNTGGGTGTLDNPISVASALSAYNANAAQAAVVKGYIVGFVSGQKLAEGATFSANGAAATNLLIADSPNESDYTKCLVVQLPAGAVRTALNLSDNPNNLGRLVTLTGSLEKYFGVAGLKSVSAYEFAN